MLRPFFALRVLSMSRPLRLLVPAVVALLLLLAAYLMRWDARALLWLQEAQTTPAQQAAQVWLPGYRAVLACWPPGSSRLSTSGACYRRHPRSNGHCRW